VVMRVFRFQGSWVDSFLSISRESCLRNAILFSFFVFLLEYSCALNLRALCEMEPGHVRLSPPSEFHSRNSIAYLYYLLREYFDKIVSHDLLHVNKKFA